MRVEIGSRESFFICSAVTELMKSKDVHKLSKAEMQMGDELLRKLRPSAASYVMYLCKKVARKARR